MIFTLTYNIGLIPITKSVICDTVGDLSREIKSLLKETGLNLYQITIK